MITLSGIYKSIVSYQKRILLLMCFLVILIPVMQSQIYVSIDEIKSCEQKEVLVPVNVTNFTDVVAITFFIHFDTTKAGFIELESIHPELNGGSLVWNFSQEPEPQIGISWTNLSPCNIVSGKLFDIRMNYFDGNCALLLSENCELVAGDLTIISDVVYEAGGIEPLIDIIVQPIDLDIFEGENASFQVSSLIGITYQWQENTGSAWLNLNNAFPYSGVQSHELLIREVPMQFDENLYRCVLFNSSCEKISDQVYLNVDSAHSINPVGIVQTPKFSIYPNPCNEFANLVLHNFPQGKIDVTIFGVNGQERLLVSDYIKDNVTREQIVINSSILSTGIYFLRLKGESLDLGTVLFKQ